MFVMSHYDILGVADNATVEEIQDIYRKLCRVYHPDKNKSPAAIEKFRQIQNSYEVLIDKFNRLNYDRSLISDPLLMDVEITLEEMMNGAVKRVQVHRKIVENLQLKNSSKFAEIPIKPGMKAETKLTFHGDGNCEIGKKPGNVIITLKQKFDPHFSRENDDLKCYYSLPADNSRYGNNYLVKLQTNRILNFHMSFEVPPNQMKNGLVRNFPGLGFPCSNNPKIRGNLIVTILVPGSNSYPFKI